MLKNKINIKQNNFIGAFDDKKTGDILNVSVYNLKNKYNKDKKFSPLAHFSLNWG